MPSITVENYLKRLYALQQEHEDSLVPLGKLADSMGLAPGTVTTMIKRLASAGQVEYEPRSGTRLSQAGESEALRVIRRHRLIELFLVEVLGYDWTEVHDEAEELEHAVSDKLITRIDEMLGHPGFDPHGDPIPAASGKITRLKMVSMGDCEPGRYRVARILDHDSSFLNFVTGHLLVPGADVHILSSDPAAEVVTIKVENAKTSHIGKGAAMKILVTALK